MTDRSVAEQPPRPRLVKRGVTSARTAGKAVAGAARAGSRRLTPGVPAGVRTAAAAAGPDALPAPAHVAGPDDRGARGARPGARQRLRRQRRGRHHDLLARRRQVRVRPAVGHPRQPDRAVLHPGGRGAPRPCHGQGPHGSHPRAVQRALGRLRGGADAHREPRLDGRRVRGHRRRAGPVRCPSPVERGAGRRHRRRVHRGGQLPAGAVRVRGHRHLRIGLLRHLGDHGQARLGSGAPRPRDPAAVVLAGVLAGRRGHRRAPPSRPGARPSSSRTRSTSACARRTWPRAASMCSPARC